MSEVPAEIRTPSKFEPILMARNLAKYSLNILANNKTFKALPTGDVEYDVKNPPQPEFVGELRKASLSIYKTAYAANETQLNKDNYKHRRNLQDKAISECTELMALIELSMKVFHLSFKRVKYWLNFTLIVRERLRKWRDADLKRYKRL